MGVLYQFGAADPAANAGTHTGSTVVTAAGYSPAEMKQGVQVWKYNPIFFFFFNRITFGSG